MARLTFRIRRGCFLGLRREEDVGSSPRLIGIAAEIQVAQEDISAGGSIHRPGPDLQDRRATFADDAYENQLAPVRVAYSRRRASPAWLSEYGIRRLIVSGSLARSRTGDVVQPRMLLLDIASPAEVLRKTNFEQAVVRFTVAYVGPSQIDMEQVAKRAGSPRAGSSGAFGTTSTSCRCIGCGRFKPRRLLALGATAMTRTRRTSLGPRSINRGSRVG